MLQDFTLLMTGAGAPGAPGILRCYRNNGERKIRVIGADMKERVPTICALDAFYSVPKATSPAFCEELLSIAKKEQVRVIQPLVTKELEVLAEHRKMFEAEGIRICCTEGENLAVANDKGRLFAYMESNGMVVPKFHIVHTVEEFEKACHALGYPRNPVCFKPTVGNGSRGFRIIDDKKDLAKLLFEEKPNSTYITMAQTLQIFRQMTAIPELLVMEFLPGEEYSVDVLADHGKTLVAIPRKRLQMNGGISVNCIVENNQEITYEDLNEYKIYTGQISDEQKAVLENSNYDADSISVISKNNAMQKSFNTSLSFLGNFGNIFVAFCLLFFAFSTIISWNFFGKINVQYMFKNSKLAILLYSAVATVFIFLGALLKSDLVWELTDFFNYLMVIPNALALLALGNIVVQSAKKKK